MIDYIRRIADRIKSGTPVIFYTVSGGTLTAIKDLRNRFNLLPAAVCDGDADKHGIAFRGMFGLTTLSFDEVNKKYPDGEYYITSFDYKFQIMGELVFERNIPRGRIINYEPVSRFRGCFLLETHLAISHDGTYRSCWETDGFHVGISERLGDTIRSFKQGRDSTAEKLKNEQETPGFKCADCKTAMESYFPENSRIREINYFGYNACNNKCIYCVVGDRNRPGFPKYKELMSNIVGSLKNDEGEGILNDDCFTVSYATAGEPTINPERDDYYGVADAAEYIVCTNAILFDPKLYDLMTKMQVKLQVSVDAGSPETYRRVKGTDSFYKVLDNLQKYSTSPFGVVGLKYIFVPGVNDCEKEAEGFVDFCVKCDALWAVLSVDKTALCAITEKTVSVMQRLKNRLHEKGILCTIYKSHENYEFQSKIKGIYA